jgi:hypothetical protein
MRSFMAAVAAILFFVPPAHADTTVTAPAALFAAAPAHDPWHIDWLSISVDAAAASPRLALTPAPLFDQPPDPQPVHAAAIEHSDAYQVRAKIHKYASFATIPLFAGELVLGQSVYNASRDGGSNKGLHVAVGTGIIGLFAANAVTGLWNLLGEDRQVTEGRGRRITHSLLMLAANAGFVATWATAPDGDDASGKTTHRAIAITSISVGTVGYLLMLLGN